MKKIIFSILFSLALFKLSYAGAISVPSWLTADDVTIAHLETERSTFQGAINSADGGLLQTGTVTTAKLDANANPENRWNEAFNDFVYSGILPPTSASLSATTTAGTAYIYGVRVVKDATAHTYTASKWTFVDLSSNGTYTYSEVAIGATEPSVAANSIRLCRVSTDATTVAAVRDDRVTGITLAAGSATSVKDTDGNTQVQTEESANEDIIRFDTAGTERAIINSNGLGLKGSTSGTITLTPAATAGTNTITFPAATGTAQVSGTQILAADGSAAVPSLSFVNDSNSGIYTTTGDIVKISLAGTDRYQFQADYMYALGLGVISFGDAGNYVNDIKYKTLSDVGCLGWFDEGVELQDGSKVSDVEAIKAIKKHPSKKTIYGAPMLDYKTFPKVSYKPAEMQGKICDRDENDNPYYFNKEGIKKPASDSVEMTSMFSIMFGAIKELDAKNQALENKVLDLEKRIEKLEKK